MPELIKKINVVIPIYNEEECISMLIERLLALKDKMRYTNINFIFVNDGSIDNSSILLNGLAEKYEFCKVIHFSRNFGHQIAASAGIDYCDGDYVVLIDADLQDPPEIIEELYVKAKEGYNVVFAQRLTRKGETLFKKITARVFYHIINTMCSIEIPKNTGDFRLFDKKVLTALKQMPEKHRFIRGMVPWVGFKSAPVLYHRDERYAGETKYSLIKMIRFAKDAMFSFSDIPLKLANTIGQVITLFGILGALYMLYIKLFTEGTVNGNNAVILTIIILGGIQINMIGIVGEYVGRIFQESKGRPLYIISETKNIE